MSILGRILKTMAALLVVVYLSLVVYAYWPHEDEVPVAELASADDRFVDVDGLQLRYRVWGEASDAVPPIVLIHGFANSAMSFEALANELPDHQIIALDMPGFGLSAKPVDYDYGNESQADTVIKFIDALGIERYIIGGHSMGGAHAVHIAANAPGVTGMILFNPGIITTGVPPATEYLVFPLPRIAAKTFGEREFRRNFLESSYSNPEQVSETRLDELMLATRSEGYMDGVTALMGYYVAGNEAQMLDDVRVPTLIVWGVDDARKPDGEAEDLDSRLATSRLVKVAHAGHYVHEEKPAETAAAISSAGDFWAQDR